MSRAFSDFLAQALRHCCNLARRGDDRSHPGYRVIGCFKEGKEGERYVFGVPPR